jgi:hypothetical protein
MGIAKLSGKSQKVGGIVFLRRIKTSAVSDTLQEVPLGVHRSGNLAITTGARNCPPEDLGCARRVPHDRFAIPESVVYRIIHSQYL